MRSTDLSDWTNLLQDLWMRTISLAYSLFTSATCSWNCIEWCRMVQIYNGIKSKVKRTCVSNDAKTINKTTSFMLWEIFIYVPICTGILHRRRGCGSSALRRRQLRLPIIPHCGTSGAALTPIGPSIDRTKYRTSYQIVYIYSSYISYYKEKIQKYSYIKPNDILEKELADFTSSKYKSNFVIN